VLILTPWEPLAAENWGAVEEEIGVRLGTLTPRELSQLDAKAEAGDRKAQYMLAIVHALGTHGVANDARALNSLQ